MSFRTRRVSDAVPARTSVAWKKILNKALIYTKPLAYFALFFLKRREEKKHEMHNILIVKRLAAILIAALLVLILLSGISWGFTALKLLSLKTIISVTGSAPLTTEKGHTNILLLGQGDKDHDGKDLIDTIMVASLDPEISKSAVLLSLPRDLYFLHTEKMGSGKLNSFYRDFKSFLVFQRGLDQDEARSQTLTELKEEIGRMLGITIHYVLKVDFTGFEKAVDAIGGVEIDVPYDIRDTLYPGPDYSYQTFEIEKGRHHVDGATALKYARSRSTTSDFDRSERQQQLLSAILTTVKEKDMHKDPHTILKVSRAIADHTHTDLTSREIIGLAFAAKYIPANRIISMQLNDRNGLFSQPTEPGGFLYTPPRELFAGSSVLLPVSIPEFPVTWRQMKSLSSLLFEERSLYLSPPTLSILNAGAPPGTARKVGNELTRYGLSVSHIANFRPRQDESALYLLNPSQKEHADVLSSIVDIKLREAPDAIEFEQKTDVVIVLGRNQRYTPFQSLLPLGN